MDISVQSQILSDSIVEVFGIHKGKWLMTESILRLALPKLFLWTEAIRFQEYPAALARAEKGRVYKRLEVERELFDILPTLEYRDGRPRGRRTDGIVNACGLERSGTRYCINGINLLKQVNDGLVATDEGLSIGALFREAADGGQWPVSLARQVLLREPRTRLLIGLMLQGSVLQVELTGLTPTGPLALVRGSGPRIVISQRNCMEFNELLNEHAEMALGQAWQKELQELGVYGDIRWEGVKGKHPSTNDLPTALKKSLALLFHVGLFHGDGWTWHLDIERLQSAFGEAVISSFGVRPPKPVEKLTEDEAFSLALQEAVDPEGFAMVSKLAETFGRLLGIADDDRSRALDAFVRKAMYDEKLKVIENHAGQPRMGRGLLGDAGSRLVRIDFEPSIISEKIHQAPGNPATESNQDTGGDQ